MEQHIAPGARVNIDLLARQLNVSPTPVREALARLEMDALVIKEPLRGYTISPTLDAKAFKDLYDLRQLLEPFAARAAAERRDDKALRALDREINDMRQTVEASGGSAGKGYREYRDFAWQDARFHEIIAGTSGNTLLSDTLRRLRSHLHLYRLYHLYYMTAEIGTATVLEHERIFAAIQAGDANRAEMAMIDHINRSRDRSEKARTKATSPSAQRGEGRGEGLKLGPPPG